jgi:hypothetical protein
MLQTKAIYNLLRLNRAKDLSVQAEPWALEDLRALGLEELFARLRERNVALDKGLFVQFAEPCDTPEQMTDVLVSDELSEEERDPVYLLIFEAWRRLTPEKPSLSIFGDELDHRIALYDQGSPDSDELVQEGLDHFLEVLEENTDTEGVFALIAEHCAHDLEGFLRDYIAELVDEGHSVYANELIEGFSPYMHNRSH